MKNIYKLIFLFIFSSTFAQSSDLFDNTWYLSNLLIDGQSHTPPSNNEVQNIPLTFFNGVAGPGITTTVCNNGGTNIVFGIIPNVFSYDSFYATLIMCNVPSNNAFESLYFNFFWEHMNQLLNYLIIDFGTAKSLVITGIDGDVATYSNQLLANSEFTTSSFNLYPNPAADFIMIESSGSSMSSGTVEIYSATGALCLMNKIDTAASKINISSLAAGSYILRITNENTEVTRKFIKL